MMMTAPIRETSTIFALSSGLGLPSAVAKTVGSAHVMHASSCMAMLTSALLLENTCSFSIVHRLGSYSSMWMIWWRPLTVGLAMMPPNKKDVPKTSKMFDKIEPNKVALTTFRSPFRRVCTDRIISTALPSVAFNNPLIVSFLIAAANSSVPSPKIFARGISAKMFNQKVYAAPQSRKCETTPRGMKTKSTEKGCQKMDMSPATLLELPSAFAFASSEAYVGLPSPCLSPETLCRSRIARALTFKALMLPLLSS
mmetsp:Transcript_13512/g.37096  ORF Transcript_13512/g.37096 Transcript_13512/m.37096 type:complete len:254 (-) Transcript_13512:353-1114(-)